MCRLRSGDRTLERPGFRIALRAGLRRERHQFPAVVADSVQQRAERRLLVLAEIVAREILVDPGDALENVPGLGDQALLARPPDPPVSGLGLREDLNEGGVLPFLPAPGWL